MSTLFLQEKLLHVSLTFYSGPDTFSCPFNFSLSIRLRFALVSNTFRILERNLQSLRCQPVCNSDLCLFYFFYWYYHGVCSDKVKINRLASVGRGLQTFPATLDAIQTNRRRDPLPIPLIRFRSVYALFLFHRNYHGMWSVEIKSILLKHTIHRQLTP